jgi:hypothetical protein
MSMPAPLARSATISEVVLRLGAELRTRAEVLDRWLIATSVRQADVARRAGFAESTVSEWRSGRKPFGENVDRLDDALAAGGAFAALAHAATTPAAFPARLAWTFNLAAPGGPWWLWVRAGGPESIVVTIRWGPVKVVVADVDQEGVIIASPVSIPNPPVRVDLTGPGYADVGPGRLPRALDIPVVNGIQEMELDHANHATSVVAEWLSRRFGRIPGWRQLVVRLLGSSGFVRDVLSARHVSSRPEDLTTVDAVRYEPPSRADLVRAREGRELSLSQAAKHARELLGSQAHLGPTKEQLRRFELGAEPRSPMLSARLDLTYRAGGRLAFEEISTLSLGQNRALALLEFPTWWVGPVWLAVESSRDRPVEVLIQWGTWEKVVVTRPGVPLAFRRSSTADVPPRTAVGAPGAWVKAGIGTPPVAIDINDNWAVRPGGHRRTFIRTIRRTYLEAFGASPEDAARVAMRHRAAAPRGTDHGGES